MEILVQNFSEILNLIKVARNKSFQAINKELIDLYWNIGEYISNKIQNNQWGISIVKSLSDYILENEPTIKGFSSQNLWRMKQFYEEYKDYPELSTLLREINWSSNLHILSKTKNYSEKLFYINLTIKEKYSVRELERQIDSCYYERSIQSNEKLSTPLREITSMTQPLKKHYKDADKIFRDNYLFEFLNLPDKFTEKDLQKELVKNIKKFLLELGRDFSFIGENYRLQVGNKDFYIDILFYHRELQCLVAFELKIDDYKPSYLGQLSFYLETLDRDVKKQHEKPSIGVLLCKSKDETVVEYSLSNTLSPALIAEYETKFINKIYMQTKIQEFLEENTHSYNLEENEN